MRAIDPQETYATPHSSISSARAAGPTLTWAIGPSMTPEAGIQRHRIAYDSGPSKRQAVTGLHDQGVLRSITALRRPWRVWLSFGSANEAAPVPRASRRRGGRVAARDPRATANDAGDRGP